MVPPPLLEVLSAVANLLASREPQRLVSDGRFYLRFLGLDNNDGTTSMEAWSILRKRIETIFGPNLVKWELIDTQNKPSAADMKRRRQSMLISKGHATASFFELEDNDVSTSSDASDKDGGHISHEAELTKFHALVALLTLYISAVHDQQESLWGTLSTKLSESQQRKLQFAFQFLLDNRASLTKEKLNQLLMTFSSAGASAMCSTPYKTGSLGESFTYSPSGGVVSPSTGSPLQDFRQHQQTVRLVEKLQKDLRETKQALDAEKSEVTFLRSEMTELNADREKLKIDLDATRGKLFASNTSMLSSVSSIESEKELEDLRRRHTILQQQFSEAKDSKKYLKTVEEQLETTMVKNKELEDKFESQKNKIVEKSKQAEQCLMQVEDFKMKLVTASNEKEEMRETISELNRQVTELQNMTMQMPRQSDAHELLLGDISMDDARGILSPPKHDANGEVIGKSIVLTLKEDIANLNEQLADEKNKTEMLVAQLDAEKSDTSSLRENNEKLTDALAQEKEKCQETMVELASEQSKIQEILASQLAIQSQLEEARTQLAEEKRLMEAETSSSASLKTMNEQLIEELNQERKTRQEVMLKHEAEQANAQEAYNKIAQELAEAKQITNDMLGKQETSAANIHELESLKSELGVQLEQAHAEIRSLTENLKNTEKQLMEAKSFENQLESTMVLNTELEDKFKTQSETIDDMLKLAEERQSTVDCLQTKLDRAKKLLEIEKSNRDALKESNDKLVGELAQERQNCQEVMDELTSEQSKVRELISAKSAAESALEQAHNQIKVSASSESELQESYARIAKELTEAKQKVSETESKLQAAETNLQEAKVVKQALQEQLEGQKSSFDEFKQAVKTSEENFSNAQSLQEAKIQELTAANNAMEIQLEQVNDQLTKEKKKSDTFVELLETEISNGATLGKANEKLVDELATEQQKFQTTLEKLEQEQAKTQELLEARSSLQSRLELVRNQLDEETKRREALRQQIEVTAASGGELQEAHNNIVRELGDKNSQLQDLSAKLEAAEATVRDLGAAKQDLQEQLEQANVTIQRLTEALRTTEDKVVEAKAILEEEISARKQRDEKIEALDAQVAELQKQVHNHEVILAHLVFNISFL